MSIESMIQIYLTRALFIILNILLIVLSFPSVIHILIVYVNTPFLFIQSLQMIHYFYFLICDDQHLVHGTFICLKLQTFIRFINCFRILLCSKITVN